MVSSRWLTNSSTDLPSAPCLGPGAGSGGGVSKGGAAPCAEGGGVVTEGGAGGAREGGGVRSPVTLLCTDSVPTSLGTTSEAAGSAAAAAAAGALPSLAGAEAGAEAKIGAGCSPTPSSATFSRGVATPLVAGVAASGVGRGVRCGAMEPEAPGNLRV